MVMFREIEIAQKGKVFLHSMPGRKEVWHDAKKAFEDNSISHVLCLTSSAEMHEKSPEYAAFFKQEQAQKEIVKRFIHISIEDFSIPKDSDFYRKQISLAADAVVQGAHLLIHCAAGIGRTGCAAIVLLQELGLSASEAQSLVLAAGSHPETDQQWGFIRAYKPIIEDVTDEYTSI